jgi:hypothetical protein
MLGALEMQAVQIYLDNGGAIHRVPFGLSGIHESNFICNSRHFGFIAWVAGSPSCNARRRWCG